MPRANKSDFPLIEAYIKPVAVDSYLRDIFNLLRLHPDVPIPEFEDWKTQPENRPWDNFAVTAAENSLLRVGFKGIVRAIAMDTEARESELWLSWQNDHLITRRDPESKQRSGRIIVQSKGQHRFPIADVIYALLVDPEQYFHADGTDNFVTTICGSRYCVAPAHLIMSSPMEATARTACHAFPHHGCIHVAKPCLRDQGVVPPVKPPKIPTNRQPLAELNPDGVKELMKKVVKGAREVHDGVKRLQRAHKSTQ